MSQWKIGVSPVDSLSFQKHGPIFNFHDYGRKSKPSESHIVCNFDPTFKDLKGMR